MDNLQRVFYYNLQRVFNYNGNNVRTVVIDGTPWFVAKDVCVALGIVNHRDAVSRLSESMKKGDVGISDAMGRLQPMIIISEPGVYKLVFRSTKPEAERFANWVASEVLPAIRKTGTYGLPAIKSPTQGLLHAVQIMAAQEQKLKQLEESQKIIQHRIDTLDNVNTVGDKRQRLNAMVRKYAHLTGFSFARAWRDFTATYNTAYRTNLMLLIANHPTQGLTIPAYLEETERLDDALRVAGKMIELAKGA